MNSRIFPVAAVVLAFLLTALVAAQAPGWFGTWHLNVEQSSFPAATPYARGRWTIEQAGPGVKMTYYLVGVRGGVTRMEWTGQFNGTPYALQGPDALVTYAYTVVDPNTLDLEVAVDGVPNVRGRVILSPDGRTLTATTSSRNARGDTVTSTSVYEKR